MELVPLLCLLFPWFGVISAQEIRSVNVPEGDDALLPCTLNSGHSIDKFDWRKDHGKNDKLEVFLYRSGSYYGHGLTGQNDQFKKRVDFFKDELKSGNASIIIRNARLEDNGTYTCGLDDPHGRVPLRLNVGAAQVPYIDLISDEITWKLLECRVKGVPKPEVEWRNSAGEELKKYIPESEDEKQSLVELKLEVTKSDNYTCVATQWSIYHQTNKTFPVKIPDAVAVSDGNNAVLPCSLDSKHIENMVFSWKKDDKEVFVYDRGRVEEDKQFTGRLTLFQNELKSGNASIEIHSTQMTDSGHYSCYFENIQKSDIMLLIAAAGKKQEPGHSTGLIVAIVVVGFLAVIIITVLSVWIHSLKNRTLKSESKPLGDTELL